ncbi:unnamed protein product [Adineta steineri]|uniref:DUF4590 domain-containing protein n=1 Tax=Adineta steineri TaxID=433720 RepID=A0A819GGY6_9BILA|nr:unnamed protein product [Adineta steineri]CAF3885132.1 unnamed protein product [Adineta steineri]
MIYLGSQTNLNTNQSEFNLNGYEIIVMQQHCGGENLIVFKNNLKPNENFTFQSRRHFDYPFALSLYVNDLIDCRISVCCEYKHKIGVPLGGKRASFAFLNIQGGQPCLTFVEKIYSFLLKLKFISNFINTFELFERIKSFVFVDKPDGISLCSSRFFN